MTSVEGVVNCELTQKKVSRVAGREQVVVAKQDEAI